MFVGYPPCPTASGLLDDHCNVSRSKGLAVAVATNKHRGPGGVVGQKQRSSSPCAAWLPPPLLWSAHGSHKTAIEQSLESKRAFGALHALKPQCRLVVGASKRWGVNPFPASCVLTRPGALQGPEACLASVLPHSRPHTPGSQRTQAVEPRA